MGRRIDPRNARVGKEGSSVSTADDTRLPGLSQAAAVKVWDAVQAAADGAHDRLLEDAELARFDRDAITRECEFACHGWAQEGRKPPGELHVNGVQVTGPSLVNEDVIRRISGPTQAIAVGTLAPLERGRLRLSERNAGRTAVLHDEFEDVRIAVDDPDAADAIGDWYKAWAARMRGR